MLSNPNIQPLEISSNHVCVNWYCVVLYDRWVWYNMYWTRKACDNDN